MRDPETTHHTGAMSSEHAPVVVCPVCGAVAPAETTRCRRCLADLRGAPTLTGEAAQASLDAVRARDAAAGRGVLARLRQRPTLAVPLLALAVALAGWVAYARFIRTPGPLPSPASRAATVASGPESWPVAGGNLGATRALSAPVALDAPAAWAHGFGAPVAVPVVADAGMLYVALTDGRLLALSAADGRERWSVPLADPPVAAPTVAGERVFVALPRGRLLAVDRDTGVVAWEVATDSALSAPPLVADGVVYAFGAPRITGVDAQSGAILWRVGVGGSVALFYPVIEGPWMAVASADRLLVFDRRTGEQTYWYAVPPVIGGVAIADGTIFVAASRTLVAVDAHSRRPWWEPARAIWFQFWVWGSAPRTPPPPALWVTRTERGGYAPVIAEDAIMIASIDGHVAAYDRRTGALRWTRTLGRIADAPVITASGLLIAQPDALRLLDPADGTDVATRPIPEGGLSAVVATADGLYLTLASGELRALR